jgi:hypothetical protein
MRLIDIALETDPPPADQFDLDPGRGSLDDHRRGPGQGRGSLGRLIRYIRERHGNKGRLGLRRRRQFLFSAEQQPCGDPVLPGDARHRSTGAARFLGDAFLVRRATLSHKLGWPESQIDIRLGRCAISPLSVTASQPISSAIRSGSTPGSR